MNRLLFCALIAASALLAQDGVERATVPFSDPNAPKKLTVSLVHGSITVKAHAAKEAVIEAKGTGSKSSSRPAPAGMRRIDHNAFGLTVDESKNQMKVGVGVPKNGTAITIMVPADTSVKLSTTSGGNIEVEGLTGEIDAHNLNGNITVRNVSGAVVADTLNGKVMVAIDKVTTDKAMSFSTLNGEVDVTLPADLKANLKIKSGHGETFSDFDIVTRGSQPRPVEESKSGRRRVRFDSALYGTINGGGPEIQFSTLNGTIYIRKKK
ncbi:MAG: hypothetical protein HY820_16315 [Acidobacteria bacterium]|nr:hypothetical protein [Acidobacteriota bacterium]